MLGKIQGVGKVANTAMRQWDLVLFSKGMWSYLALSECGIGKDIRITTESLMHAGK